MISIESFGPTAATMGGGFFVGVLIGYALKKVIKLVAVIVGIFLAVLAYLQYDQIANINWNKLQTVSEDAITTFSNAITKILAKHYQRCPCCCNIFLIINDKLWYCTYW